MSLKSEINAAPVRHFLDLADLTSVQLRSILTWAAQLKAARRAGKTPLPLPLAGKTVAMVFEQPSLRTRVSFEVGIRELGGTPIMLTGAEIELGKREAIADTARVLSRYVDAIMIRMLDHDKLIELARFSSVPVINGLTKRSHPCQVLADVLTFEEHRGSITGRKIAWVGDSNNVLASWVQAAARLHAQLHIATPQAYAPPAALLAWAQAQGAQITVGTDAVAAVRDAACVITDSWVSMGDKDSAERQALLSPYQVNEALMAHAATDALFMHCLPAHRNEEVTDAVMDGAQSVIFDEAENRLHAQKGVLAWCFAHTEALGDLGL